MFFVMMNVKEPYKYIIAQISTTVKLLLRVKFLMNLSELFVCNMSIYLSSSDIGMTKHDLNRSNISTI